MKISSITPGTNAATTSPDRTEIADLSPIRRFLRKIDRMLTAISYAEAGNFDAVKEILDQDKVEAQLRAKAKRGLALPPGYGVNGTDPVSDLS